MEPGIRQKPETGLSEGVYCISATMLQSLYLGYCSGPWIEHYEQIYQQALAEINKFEAIRDQAFKDNVPLSDRMSPAQFQYFSRMYLDFERLRLGRLFAYLRGRDPIHVVNGSILVYRLSPGDLEAALIRPLGAPPRPNPQYAGQAIQY